MRHLHLMHYQEQFQVPPLLAVRSHIYSSSTFSVHFQQTSFFCSQTDMPASPLAGQARDLPLRGFLGSSLSNFHQVDSAKFFYCHLKADEWSGMPILAIPTDECQVYTKLDFFALSDCPPH